MHNLCTPVGVLFFQGVTPLPRFPIFPSFMIVEFFLDRYYSIMVFARMAKTIVKVDAGGSSFRIVLPRKLIQEMAWEKVSYVVIEKFLPHGIKIRSLLYDETDEG